MRQRPISVTIFGILNIGFGLWSFGELALTRIMPLVKLPGNEAVKAMQSDPGYHAWTNVSVAYSIAAGVTLLAAGVGLLLLRNWARIASIVFAAVDIPFVIVGLLVSVRVMAPMMEQMKGVPPGLATAVTAILFVFGLILGLTYPVLLLIFMTRPKVVEALKEP